MSRLLRGIFCVVEIFHRYAGEDGDNQATLTRRELRQLLEGEIGDFLQPHVFRAVERKLNLLDFDRDGTISFEEFILAIFSLSNPSYFDISLLHSEPRLMSKSEKMDAVDFGAIAGNTQQVAGVGPTQERLIFPSEVASSGQPSNEEGEVGDDPIVSPREDIKTHGLPRNVSEPNDPENQQPKEDAQEVTQNVQATEYDGIQFKRNTAVQAPKQSTSPTQEIPGERSKPSRRQSDTTISDHMIQRPTEDEEHSSSTQDPLLQKEDKATGSVHTDLPVVAATGKSSQTQEFFEPMDDTRLSETQETGKDAGRIPPKPTNLEEPKADTRVSQSHELPAQEREHKTRDQSVQSWSRNASETSSRGELEEEEEAGKDHERITRSPEPEAETRDEKCQEFSGSWRENDAKRGSALQEPSSKEGNQNLPEIKEESISGEEARHSEEDTVDAFAINENSPADEETLGTRERFQELALLEKQSRGRKHRTARTHDKPVRKEDHNVLEDPELSVIQSDEGFCETPNSLAPEVGEDNSETAESHVPGDSQTQVDHHGDAKQESYNNNPDPQKQGAPVESSREQEAVVLSIQEDGQHPEELDLPAREKQDGLSSRTKGGPGAAVEPSEGGEVEEATAGSKNRKSLEAEGLEA